MSNLSGNEWEKRLLSEGISSFDVWAMVNDLKRAEKAEAELAEIKRRWPWIITEMQPIEPPEDA